MPLPKLTLAVCCAVFLFVTSGCGPALYGSDAVVTQSFEKEIAGGFTQIEVSHACRASVSRADTARIEITINENFVPYLDVYRIIDTLYISLDEENDYEDMHCEASLATSELEAVTVHGAAQVWLNDRFESDRFTLNLTGASRFDGAVKTERADVSLSGATIGRVCGAADALDLSASGASRIDLSAFHSENADVEISGASTAHVHANDDLSGLLSGASVLYYYGHPNLADLHTSGAAHIKSGE